MIIYLVVFATSTFLIYSSRKEYSSSLTRKVNIFLSILIPSILAGVRDYSIGGDVLLYGNAWFYRAVYSDSILTYLSSASRQSIGVGYAILNYLVSIVTSNPHWFYFILCTLEMVLLNVAISDIDSDVEVAICYIVYFYFYFNNSLNLLRQIPAMLFVLAAFSYVKRNSIMKTILFLLLAISFHNTAIVGVFVISCEKLLESRLKDVYKYIIIAIALLSIIYIAQITQFLSYTGIISIVRYGTYLNDEGVTGGRYIRLVYYGIVYLLFTARKTYVEEVEPKCDFYYMLCTLSTVATMLLFLFDNSYIIRIAYYFDIFMILYIPQIILTYDFKLGNIKKIIPIYIMGIIFFTYWLIVYVIRNGAATYPYLFMQY